jgi:predicted regulator of Ras-like GTPase activity (Roadblock/LC7/MglB family)
MSFRSILREHRRGVRRRTRRRADGRRRHSDRGVRHRPDSEGPLQEDVGSAGVEFSRILDEIRKAADAWAAARSSETVVSLARMSLVFRPIDGETFLALVLSTDGNLGKARYLIRRHLLAIRQEL